MKYSHYKENYIESNLKEEVTFSSDETTDTNIVKRKYYTENKKQKKGKEEKRSFVNYLKIKNKPDNINKQLSIGDNFKILIYGCMGIRTYKVYCYIK
ncbi:conserved Plasmodium protein, unknown function [Plasmodium reichenowi]|uniref:Uncharacterized protein n=1 Tax=Plasmodium reichenowi TaxID=5854 RepID=A0A060RPI6_PLARE|nr:hypothetical protein PRSY57_0520700 [Plasmodium reichenowi]KYO01616.1 hypothetical protein PRSY57_0520700 [Plasmodium reichenowi]CDO63094.1 conserved Plasmodium protein, unknown function [Plasmodium reichenowi]SOV76860.1 conserved Plasmodium protein, unknown function [Plasmodium reichenowi]